MVLLALHQDLNRLRMGARLSMEALLWLVGLRAGLALPMERYGWKSNVEYHLRIRILSSWSATNASKSSLVAASGLIHSASHHSSQVIHQRLYWLKFLGFIPAACQAAWAISAGVWVWLLIFAPGCEAIIVIEVVFFAESYGVSFRDDASEVVHQCLVRLPSAYVFDLG